MLAGLGYRCVHRSAEAGNYIRGDERVDFLYADGRSGLDLDQVREYFRIFEREPLLDELLHELLHELR